MSTRPYAIHWFRRDLRIAGNSALKRAWKEFDGRVVGLFCFDRTFLSRSDFSHNRFGFFLQTLLELKKELKDAGGDLLVIDAPPRQGFEKIINLLSQSNSGPPGALFFNRDYEPFARKRDEEVTRWISEKMGIHVYTERDHLLIEPEELVKDKPGSFYQVYSPFARRWFEMMAGTEIQTRIANQGEAIKYLERRAAGKPLKEPLFGLSWKALLPKEKLPEDQLDAFIQQNQKKLTVKLPRAGTLAALDALDLFRPKVDAYQEKRDFPDLPGTSKMSLYLKNGSITIAQILAALELNRQQFKQKTSATHYVKELAWREFYYHILWHCPRVEHESFNPKYKNIEWENNESLFEAWKEGRTGYPIVDAGMRELRTTGWMHNRVRMIVASFLTKDLLIDWRWGEKWFMEQLLDGDLAPNNGGWQWAASTGCDPQPYFRIFNPSLQSERFDPEARYIQHFVPELKGESSKRIHHWEGSLRHPGPIVDHARQKIRALRMYKI